MNDELYKEYEYETEIGGQHTCTYAEWLEWKVLETTHNSDYEELTNAILEMKSQLGRLSKVKEME